jgi:hypothetical protein
MEYIELSTRQYLALLKRLDEINSDLRLMRFKTGQETAFIDNYSLSKLLKVSFKTLQRWRRSGRLPYMQLGNQVYYRADIILDSFKCDVTCVDKGDFITASTKEVVVPEENTEMICRKCPLYLLLLM